MNQTEPVELWLTLRNSKKTVTLTQVVKLPRVPCVGEYVCIECDVVGDGRRVEEVHFMLHNIPVICLQRFDYSALPDSELDIDVEEWINQSGFKLRFP